MNISTKNEAAAGASADSLIVVLQRTESNTNPGPAQCTCDNGIVYRSGSEPVPCPNCEAGEAQWVRYLAALEMAVMA